MSRLWTEAAVFLLLSGVASGDFGLQRWSVDRTWEASSSFRESNSTQAVLGASPYTPGHGIVDPFSDINCEAEKCVGGTDSCKEFPYRLCRAYANCDNHVCLHKNLFPMLQEDLILFATMFIIAVCAGAAGIGGGGLNVPVLMMLSSFGIKEAVPLSHAAVMGNSFAQLLFNFRLRHPSTEHRPLIHYELAILALPAQLGGNSLGVVIGRTFPPSLLIILSLVMLALASTKTFIKGFEVYKDFRAKKKPALAQTPAPASPSLPALPPRSLGPAGQSLQPVPPPSPLPTVPMSPPLARRVSKEDLRLPSTTLLDVECPRTASGTILMPRSMAAEHLVQAMSARSLSSASNGHAPTNGHAVEAAEHVKMRVPWQVVATMIAFNVVFCLDFLAMSPDVFDVKKCSVPYWFALLGLYPFVVASLWIGVRSLRDLKAYHESRNDPPVAGDPEVSARLIILFPLAAVVIGLIAGLVGLGGGEFMVPLLLEFGLLPRVASATSGFLILFATSSNIVHYFAANIMTPFIQYGVGVFCLAFFGAAAGLGIRDTKFMREHSYLLVFLLAGLLTVSGALLAYRGFVMSAWDGSFKQFCS